MGEPQSRKRKIKKVGAEANNNIVKDVKVLAEDANKSNIKAKKNKVAKSPTLKEIDNETNNIKPVKPNKLNFVQKSNEAAINDSDMSKPKPKKAKKQKSVENVSENDEIVAKRAKPNEEKSSFPVSSKLTEEMLAQYPILKDEELVKRFMAVSMSNNQKGRIRQTLRDSLKGTSESMLPEVIHTRMQAILKTDLTEAELRRLRILYNMLKTAVKGNKYVGPDKPKQKKAKDNATENKKPKKVKDNATEDKKPKKVKEDDKEGDKESKKKPEQKVKGPKRYVVFIGNLPLDISKEKILEHFSSLSKQIKDVRMPKPHENKKSRIAYLEVASEVAYELALSKHHSMLDNKRINVLYSTQQGSKISKTEAKGKAAKLVAMQKSGQLAGSVPLNKKRSARRKKMKQAQKKAQEEMDKGV